MFLVAAQWIPPMANPKPSTKPEPESKSHSRTVLKLLAEFNPSDSNSSQIRSLAISTLSDSQALIYLGTTSGSLLSLSVNPNSPSTSSTLVCHRQVIVGGSPVNSIHVIEDIGKIIVVSDGFLYLVDLLLLDPVKKLSLIKGVTTLTRRFQSRRISTGSDNVVQRLNGMKLKEDGCFFAVAVGKKLMLVELVFSGSLVILKEFQGISEGIISLAWVDDSIIIGTRNGYYLYSLSSGQSGLLFSLPDLSGPPLMKILCKEWKVMLMMDNVGVIVDAEGQPVGGSLVFREAPDSIGEIGSYVVVMRNGKVELYHRKSRNCVQRVPFAGEVGNKCIVADEGGNSRGKLVALATGSKVMCYQKVPSEEQIKDLLRKKNVGEAVSLIEELWNEGEITKDMLSFVHAQVGFLLLFDLHFAEAVDHFLLSETMQPSELFPFIMREPNRWSLLVPRNRYWGLHPPPAPLEKVIDDGLMAVQRAIFLKKAGVETAVDDKFLLNPPSRADLLEIAVKNMTRYLKVSRFKDLTLPVKEGVDTLLMYLYRALNRVDDMEKLASSDNNCVVEELESLLNESGHLRTLAFLYASKGLSSKALAIWRILARNSSNMKEPAVVNDLQDNSKSVDSDQETVVIEASKILEESSDQDLVLQHLGWISDINQVLAVQVLISEKRMDLFSPDDVIAAIDPKKVEILLRYLQWLIEDKELDDPQYHTTYALLLAKSALDAYEIEHLSENSIFDNHVRERLQIFLQSSDLYDPEEVLDLIEGSELWMEKAILYRKLGQEALVLQILALKLEDCEAAEQYCAEIGRPDAYMQLLDMYLDPMNGKEPMFAAAVRLLHNHGEMLDPLQVLERLSPDMPLQLASETMLRMLRARLHHHHQGQIVHNLSHALEVDASLARLEERSRHVLINDESVCDSCHARLGTKLFAMYPDDTIVCYKCFRRQGESTSVTGRNFKKDSIYKPGWLVTR